LTCEKPQAKYQLKLEFSHMKKAIVSLGLLSLAAVALVACGSRDERSTTSSEDAKTNLKVAMITENNGVDDKSFNQSAWEGLEQWGKDNGLSKGNGYNYFQSGSESEFATTIDNAVTEGYKLIFGVGFKLHTAIEDSATNNPDTNYVIIDDVISGKGNVASAVFADNESAYLAGVAAAKTTKTNKLGFIGGIEGETIKRFEAGFVAGAKSVNPSIKVSVDYTGSFSDAAKGKALATTQYDFGADIIYQAAGGSGAGVLSEAKALNETKDADKKVWVIGVDRDQADEGNYVSNDDKESNFILTSTVKGVGKALIAITDETENGDFPGGQTLTYGLKEDAVSLTEGQLSDDAKKAVETAKQAIIDGDVIVPEQ
jgi:basic membrane protein A